MINNRHTYLTTGHSVAVAVLFLATASSLRAQLLDSISLFMQEPPRLTVRLDTRGSFISNENVRLFGVKGGLEHAGRVQYGVGYNFLITPVERVREIEGAGLVTTRLRLWYVSLYFDYAFYERGPWEVRIPVQLGIGAGSVAYRDVEGRRQVLQRTMLFFYEPAMTVHYHFLRYFAVGGGIGYRLVLRTSASLGEHFTAPTYLFGLRIAFGDIWRDVQGDPDR